MISQTLIAREFMRVVRLVFSSGVVVLSAAFATAEEAPSPQARAQLDEAWSTFQRELDEARDSLVNPAHFAPLGTEQNLAEGHRYLLGHLGRHVAQAHGREP